MQEARNREPAGEELLDVVVVGGSQAGLAMAWHFARRGLRFVVLEAGARPGHVWRSRWDSLKLFTPAQYNALPGLPFPGPADSYPTKDPVGDYLEAYANAFHLPVRLNARVIGLRRTEDGVFEVHTAQQTYRARQVVVATGPFQVPFIPPAARGLDKSVTQRHSSKSRNPQSLPDGPVLVVGGGNSGFQIAEELTTTRQVDLSIGSRNPKLPQRLAGKDLFWWLTRLGLMRVTASSRLGRRIQARGEFAIGSNGRRRPPAPPPRGSHDRVPAPPHQCLASCLREQSTVGGVSPRWVGTSCAAFATRSAVFARRSWASAMHGSTWWPRWRRWLPRSGSV